MRSVAFSTHCCGEGPFKCCVVCPSGEGCVAVFVSRSGEVGVSCVEETVAVKPVMEGDWVGQRVSESEETVRETVEEEEVCEPEPPMPPAPSFKPSGGLFGSSSSSSGGLFGKKEEKKEDAPMPPAPSFKPSGGLFGSSSSSGGLFGKKEEEKKEEKKEDAPMPPAPSFKPSGGLFGSSSSSSGGLFGKKEEKKEEKKEDAPMPPPPSFSHTPLTKPAAPSKPRSTHDLLAELKHFYSQPLTLLLDAINSSVENVCTAPALEVAETDFSELDAVMETLAAEMEEEEEAFREIARGVECLNLQMLELEKKKEVVEGVSLKQIGKEIQEKDAAFAREYALLEKVKANLAALETKTKQVAGSMNALKDAMVVEYEFKLL